VDSFFLFKYYIEWIVFLNIREFILFYVLIYKSFKYYIIWMDEFFYMTHFALVDGLFNIRDIILFDILIYKNLNIIYMFFNIIEFIFLIKKCIILIKGKQLFKFDPKKF
jgi:hypothetical protein